MWDWRQLTECVGRSKVVEIWLTWWKECREGDGGRRRWKGWVVRDTVESKEMVERRPSDMGEW